MVKEFDYITAWHQAAKPMYDGQPQAVKDLVARTAEVAADLGQLSDCSMPWPNDTAFRQAFRGIDSETLSLASCVVQSAEHWKPSDQPALFPPGIGWKFSHYADQELRARLGLPERGANGRERGLGLAIHEGKIRVTWASKDSWMWEEVAPATASGREYASAILSRFSTLLQACSEGPRDAKDQIMFHAFNEERQDRSGWPVEWLPFVDHRFMVEADIVKAREQAKPQNLVKTRADLLKRTAQKIADLERERDGLVWFLDHGIGVGNCIYYPHTNRFCFGWRDLVSPAVESQILDVVSEFPYAYTIKCQDGRKLEGD